MTMTVGTAIMTDATTRITANHSMAVNHTGGTVAIAVADKNAVFGKKIRFW